MLFANEFRYFRLHSNQLRCLLSAVCTSSSGSRCSSSSVSDSNCSTSSSYSGSNSGSESGSRPSSNISTASSAVSSEQISLTNSMGIVDENEAKQDRKRFAELFRHSKFVQLGDFEGRVVIGEIIRRIADDLYIDMGLKFYAVCRAPVMKNESYKIGAKVLLRLHNPELSELFLGSTKELTLLEADATLLGLYHATSDESKKVALLSNLQKEIEKMKARKPESKKQSDKSTEKAISS